MAPIPNILRGDIVLVDLNPAKGSEQRGHARPCVVVQNDIGNTYSNTTIIVPVTDAVGKKVYPFQSPISKGSSGLTKDSIALGNQIRVISKERIKKKMGALPEAEVVDLNRALVNSLGLR
jgi:mRNA interferase MazF